jgi:hypothetical protein
VPKVGDGVTNLQNHVPYFLAQPEQACYFGMEIATLCSRIKSKDRVGQSSSYGFA